MEEKKFDHVFDVQFTVDLRIAFDNDLSEYVNTEDFKRNFYTLKTKEDLAEFIAYAVAANYQNKMSDIEGFMKEHDPMMKVLCYPEWNVEESKEVKVNWDR
jgi:hypothetical protein